MLARQYRINVSWDLPTKANAPNRVLRPKFLPETYAHLPEPIPDRKIDTAFRKSNE